MPTSSYMSKTLGSHLIKIIIIGMVVQLFVVAYVFQDSYQGRKDLVSAQRKACELGKKDRLSSSLLASASLIALKDTDRYIPGPARPLRKKAEADISVELVGLKKRARLDCTTAFPGANAWP